MKKLAAALGALAGGVGTVAGIGSWRWKARTTALVTRLRAAAEAEGAPTALTTREREELPGPVARYFRAVLPDVVPSIRCARLEQRGQFLLRKGPNGWRPFHAVEHFTPRPPGFVWDARIRMAPGLDVMVRDGFVEGHGMMLGSMLGIWRVVSVEGTPALDAGALQRYLAEAVWLPTALLPSAGVSWRPLDGSSARATLTAGGTTVSVDVHFGTDGLVERVYAAARARDVGGGRMVPTPWQGRFSSYARRAGLRIPMAGEVDWILSEGPQPYWKGELTGVTYEEDGAAAVAPRRRSGRDRFQPSLNGPRHRSP
jgi:hypothetical protein